MWRGWRDTGDECLGENWTMKMVMDDAGGTVKRAG